MMNEYERLSKMNHEMSARKFGTCDRHKNGEDFGLHPDTCAYCGFNIRLHPVDLKALTGATEVVEGLGMEALVNGILTADMAVYLSGMIKNAAHNSEPYGDHEEFAVWSEEDWRKVGLWEKYLMMHFKVIGDNIEHDRSVLSAKGGRQG